ncbi:MAG: hypothetical protein LKI27_05445 [Actinomyces sp.]|nr:hypothetical protein [Actinomyces sp.]MCI1662323.1 hypothetical protein [Actinomyces sp.]
MPRAYPSEFRDDVVRVAELRARTLSDAAEQMLERTPRAAQIPSPAIS